MTALGRYKPFDNHTLLDGKGSQISCSNGNGE